MAAARISRPETSPYFGVQKRGGRYVAEIRNLTYENIKLGKFYRRTADELEAAFLIDAINYFGPNKKNYTYNFVNGQKVLTMQGSQCQKGLDERLAKSCLRGKEYRDHVSKEYKSFLMQEVTKLWKTHRKDILMGHVRPPLYQGSSKPSSRQIIQGERWIGEETEVIPRKSDNQGLSEKFDVDGGLILRAPRKEGDLKKIVSLPPALEEHQGSHSGIDGSSAMSGENLVNLYPRLCIKAILVLYNNSSSDLFFPRMKYLILLATCHCSTKKTSLDDPAVHTAVSVDSRRTLCCSTELEDNKVLHMKIRCAEYENWWKVAGKFIAPYFQKREMKLVHEIAPLLKLREAIQYPFKQEGPEFARMHFENQQGSRCALYEQIYDIVTSFVDSECPPEEIKRYQAETGPIIQRCRANWHY